MDLFQNVRTRADTVASYFSKDKQSRRQRWRGLISTPTSEDISNCLESIDSLISEAGSSVSSFINEIRTEGQKKVKEVKNYFGQQHRGGVVRENFYQRGSAFDDDGELFAKTFDKATEATTTLERTTITKDDAIKFPDWNLREGKGSSNLQGSNKIVRDRNASSFLPFCEKYDGVIKGETNTISESVQTILKTKTEMPKRPEVKRLSIKVPNEENISVDKTSNLQHTSSLKRISFHTRTKQTKSIDIKEELRRVEESSQVVKIITTDQRMKSDNETKLLDGKDYGTIKASVQYLVITEMLKITIENAIDIPNENQKCMNAFVKVDLVLEKKRHGKQTKQVKGIDSFVFKKDIYFRKLDLVSAHMSNLRFRVFMKTADTFALKPNTCIGEAFVSLDNLDIVGRVTLCEKLRRSK